jgi:hypothetical protein
MGYMISLRDWDDWRFCLVWVSFVSGVAWESWRLKEKYAGKRMSDPTASTHLKQRRAVFLCQPCFGRVLNSNVSAT